MKIALFGATGKTGRPFVRKALEKGYEVKALVRDPGRLSGTDERLEVVRGDFTVPGDIDRCIEGTSVVVSLVGHRKGSDEGFQTRGIGYVLESMRKHGVGRIISLTGAGVRDPENDHPKFPDKMMVFIMKNLAGSTTRNALMDGMDHAGLIRSFEGEWTIVRGPMLTGDPAKGSYLVGHVGTVGGFRLTREDLADFLVTEIEEKKYIGQMPFLTNG